MTYELFCYSVQGASHIKRGIPCQDYGMKFENGDCKIFVLGDGHGDSNCVRSDYGSRTVCETAVEELRVFAETVKSQGLVEDLLDKYQTEGFVNQLVTSIFGKWSCKVNEHFVNTPLSEVEQERAKAMLHLYQCGERIEHIYGTTFLAGVMTDEYLLLLHQGDGKCVVFGSDGVSSEPVPWDDRCISPFTTSVCDSDAVQSCRYHIIDLRQNPIIACILCSDGIDDSFSSSDSLHLYYRGELLFAAESGTGAFEERMAETFPDISKNGSGDDSTLCGVIDREAVKKFSRKFLEENEKVSIRNEIGNAEERIASMEPKLEHLKTKRDEAEKNYTDVQRRYFELTKEYEEIKADVDSHENSLLNRIPGIKVLSAASMKHLRRCLKRIGEDIESARAELDSALVKKTKCDDEYIIYKQKYDDFVAVKRECERQLKEASSPKSESDILISENAAEPTEVTPPAEAEKIPEIKPEEQPKETTPLVIKITDEPIIFASTLDDEIGDLPEQKAEPNTHTEIKDATEEISDRIILSDEAIADMVRSDSEKPNGKA